VTTSVTALSEIHEAASLIVKAAKARWTAPGYHPHVTCAGDINMGPCSEFAEEVVEELLQRFPDCDARVMDTVDVLEEYGRENGAYHAFVAVGGRYYDSTEPDGVSDPTGLRIVYRIWDQATPVEDGEETSAPYL
jgi:hypothetical protein